MRLSPFSLILVALAAVSLATEMLQGSSLVKTVTTPAVMLAMMVLSELVRLVQERRARRVYERVVDLARTRTAARAGARIALRAGCPVPGDVRLESAVRLVVSQAMLTGESGAVEKRPGDLVYAGSRVLAGTGEGVVVAVGAETAYGRLLPRATPRTVAFDPGANAIAGVLVRFMLVLVPVVFAVVGLTRGNLVAAFLFALSVAVGLVPEMLPLVINACLAKGSHAMGRRKTIVRNLRAMQALGGVDVLCIDKTGTLTGDHLVLEYYLDILGRESARTLELAYVASSRAANPDDPFEAAVLRAREMPGAAARLDALARNGAVGPVLKGPVSEVVPLCRLAELGGELLPVAGTRDVAAVVDEMTEDGMRVQAVACRRGEDYVLVGYLAFFDAPKKSARAALAKLRNLHVGTKVLTGDNRLTAASVCRRLGLPVENLLTGDALEALTDDALVLRVEETSVFAELTPRQKARVVAAIRENGHAVGFVGDGLNDLPALLAASVAISVDTAAGEAKDISDVILLRKDLDVLEAGILEGRRAFQNMSKYVRIAAASNFGNICSIVAASAFLPFLPMTAAQILALNLLFDGLCFVLPWDRVDAELTARPLAWSGHSLARFMVRFGPVSTFFDLVAFACLYFHLCPAACGGSYAELDAAGREHFVALFQTGWFVASLWSQILILHLLRTPRISFVQSVASRPVMGATLLALAAFSFLPWTSLGSLLGLGPVPAAFSAFLAVDVVLYMGVTSFVKSRYLRAFGSFA